MKVKDVIKRRLKSNEFLYVNLHREVWLFEIDKNQYIHKKQMIGLSVNKRYERARMSDDILVIKNA